MRLSIIMIVITVMFSLLLYHVNCMLSFNNMKFLCGLTPLFLRSNVMLLLHCCSLPSLTPIGLKTPASLAALTVLLFFIFSFILYSNTTSCLLRSLLNLFGPSVLCLSLCWNLQPALHLNLSVTYIKLSYEYRTNFLKFPSFTSLCLI